MNTSARERIIESAAHLLMRNSYASLSVDDICRAAETQKGTFYHHFKSKTDLAGAALEHMWGIIGPQLRQILTGPGSALSRFRAYAEFAHDYHQQIFATEGRMYGCPLAAVGQETVAEESTIREFAQKVREDEQGMIENALTGLAHITPAERPAVARQIQALAAGVMYQAALLNDPSMIRNELWPGIARLLHVKTDQEE
jgi:TetR/AcrR family transcriptional repressor of nem operon